MTDIHTHTRPRTITPKATLTAAVALAATVLSTTAAPAAEDYLFAVEDVVITSTSFSARLFFEFDFDVPGGAPVYLGAEWQKGLITVWGDAGWLDAEATHYTSNFRWAVESHGDAGIGAVAASMSGMGEFLVFYVPLLYASATSGGGVHGNITVSFDFGEDVLFPENLHELTFGWGIAAEIDPPITIDNSGSAFLVTAPFPLEPPAPAIPEPSSYALLGAIGAVGLAFLRRRKKSSR